MNLSFNVTGGSGGSQKKFGSASAPAYSFTNDTDTGIYRIGADSLSFSFAWSLDRAREFITTSLKAGLEKEFIRSEVLSNMGAQDNLVTLELFDEYGLL